MRKLDLDIKVLRAIERALRASSSRRMLRANLHYFCAKYLTDRDAPENVAAAIPVPVSAPLAGDRE